jgi:hypothetical protein
MAAQISCFRNHDNTRHKATSEMKKKTQLQGDMATSDFSSAVLLDYKAYAWWMCIHSFSHRPRNQLGVIHAVQSFPTSLQGRPRRAADATRRQPRQLSSHRRLAHHSEPSGWVPAVCGSPFLFLTLPANR